MLLELVTCAFAVFGTLSCDDGGNADAGEKFQELVLAYEEVLETKGDRKLRGLKDIHQQLDEIATRYPDADVTAKILSSNIVGINLSRVERAIQKLDPDFNKQTETIVVGDVSSSYEVMEAPYNDLIVQIASVPHVPKNLPIEVKAVPQKEVLVVSTKQQPPITLPTAKLKRETPVVVADIPLPIAKPEVQSRKQPVKQLASSLPTTADWNMLFMPTAFSGGSSFKSSSTWNNLGPQRSQANIAPSQVILAQAETDALGDGGSNSEIDLGQAATKQYFLEFSLGHSINSSMAWRDTFTENRSGTTTELRDLSAKVGEQASLTFGLAWEKQALKLSLEAFDNTHSHGTMVTQDGTIYPYNGHGGSKKTSLILVHNYFYKLSDTVDIYSVLGVGKVKHDLEPSFISTSQQTRRSSNYGVVTRLGAGILRKISDDFQLFSQIQQSNYASATQMKLSENESNLETDLSSIDVKFGIRKLLGIRKSKVENSSAIGNITDFNTPPFYGEVRLANSLGDSISWEDTVSGSDKFSSINNPKTENGLGYGIAIGKNIVKYRTAIVLEHQPATDFVTGAVTTAGGTTYQKLKVPLDITTAMIEAERDVISIPKGNVFLLGGIGQSQVKSGAMVYTTNSGETISGQNHTSSNTVFRYGLGLTHRLGESVILRGAIQNTSHGEIFTKTPEGTTPFSFKLDSHDFTIGVQKHF